MSFVLLHFLVGKLFQLPNLNTFPMKTEWPARVSFSESRDSFMALDAVFFLLQWDSVKKLVGFKSLVGLNLEFALAGFLRPQHRCINVVDFESSVCVRTKCHVFFTRLLFIRKFQWCKISRKYWFNYLIRMMYSMMYFKCVHF